MSSQSEPGEATSLASMVAKSPSDSAVVPKITPATSVLPGSNAKLSTSSLTE
ncbi:MAG TPA: hypothetical protein VGQ74_11815 [Methylomirabilota bacterium]|nr:hypothetical protein [Methylomirabilota bacterium]